MLAYKKPILTNLLVTMLCLCAPYTPHSFAASDQVPAPKQTRPIALSGGTIHTVSGENIAAGTVLFEKGRITAVGKDLILPDGTEIIDVSGKHVYPGLISTNTAIGLVEIAAVRATRDVSEVGEINPEVRAQAAFNPDSEIIPVTRANGVTLALSVPGGGLISGTSALMMLDGWTWEDMTLKAPVGLHLFWPEMAIDEALDTKSQKKRKEKRDNKIRKIRDTFSAARAYMKAKDAESSSAVPYHDSDTRLEALRPVLKKEIPVFVHADGIQEIQAALDWTAEQDLRVVLVGGYDAWRIPERLKQQHVAVVVAGTQRLPMRRWEDYDAPFTLPARLHELGIPFCIATQGGSFMTPHERNLPYHAANAAAYGLPRQEALKAVTLYPAQIMGVSDRVGSIEVSKDATLIVTDGDPLEIMTHVEMEFIQGRKIDLSSRHTELYEKYLEKYRRLGLTGKTP